jgi:hypothetical protein
MTLSEFYRDEAARCQLRAEKSRRPDRAQRWNAFADEYLQLSLSIEDTPGNQQKPIFASTPQAMQPHNPQRLDCRQRFLKTALERAEKNDVIYSEPRFSHPPADS